MQSDAKSAFCKKSNQKGRPGLHFGGLWDHFEALWAPNGIPEAIFCEVENLMQKRAWTELDGVGTSWTEFPSGGGGAL